jgi:DNA-binding NarL/FixJ family response regulator
VAAPPPIRVAVVDDHPVVRAGLVAILAREALRLGVRGYLLKGSSAESLVAAVRSVWQGQRVVDPALASRVVELEAGPGTLTGRQRRCSASSPRGAPTGRSPAPCTSPTTRSSST